MLQDTGERIIPPTGGEVSYLFERHKMAYLFAMDRAKEAIVLDAGCGTGYGSQVLANVASEVHAVDYSFDALEYSKRYYFAENTKYLAMDANALAFESGVFDLIVSFQVIEHMKSLDTYLGELTRVLKENGQIIISTPNVQPSQKQRGSDNKFHFNELTYDEAKSLMENYFKQVQFYGTHYAENNSLRSLIQKSFLYRTIGRRIPRKSMIKKVANSSLKLDQFVVSKDRIRKAMDLIIVAQYPQDRR